MLNQTASSSEAFVVGDQKVAILLYPEFKIVQATFWNTNNGGNSKLIFVSAEYFPVCISKTGKYNREDSALKRIHPLSPRI